MNFCLLLALLPFAYADVLRTVFCQDACNDYLKVPESTMPLCAEEHYKLNECGTVVTCDLSDLGRDKERSIANSTDFICCYRTIIKEEGQCGGHIEQAPSVPQTTSYVPMCAEPMLPWLIASILFVIVTFQAGYIIWLYLQKSSIQKVVHAVQEPCMRPNFQARPLIDTRLSV